MKKRQENKIYSLKNVVSYLYLNDKELLEKVSKFSYAVSQLSFAVSGLMIAYVRHWVGVDKVYERSMFDLVKLTKKAEENYLIAKSISKQVDNFLDDIFFERYDVRSVEDAEEQVASFICIFDVTDKNEIKKAGAGYWLYLNEFYNRLKSLEV